MHDSATRPRWAAQPLIRGRDVHAGRIESAATAFQPRVVSALQDRWQADADVLGDWLAGVPEVLVESYTRSWVADSFRRVNRGELYGARLDELTLDRIVRLGQRWGILDEHNPRRRGDDAADYAPDELECRWQRLLDAEYWHA